jgi:large subunit ribosomal protein L9
VPQGKAKMATAENLAEFEAQRAELEKAAAEALATAESRRQAIEALGVVEITARVGSEGKLFGSIGVGDVCDAIEAMGGDVQTRIVIFYERLPIWQPLPFLPR